MEKLVVSCVVRRTRGSLSLLSSLLIRRLRGGRRTDILSREKVGAEADVAASAHVEVGGQHHGVLKFLLFLHLL